jgi:hypothetical protein
LNLPAVEETDEEQPLESAEVAELPVLQPALVEVESDDDEPAPDEELLRKAEALADTGFEEIVASEWPDPAATELNVVDAGDAAEEPAGEESRSADASVHSA